MNDDDRWCWYCHGYGMVDMGATELGRPRVCDIVHRALPDLDSAPPPCPEG